MVFNATFNNIAVISWYPVLLVEETGVRLVFYPFHIESRGILIDIQNYFFSRKRNPYEIRVRVTVFTFHKISVILWWSVSFLEKTEVRRENHRPAASH
jgi:hypothetical protein